MTSNFILLLGAGTALFLAGINAAFLLQLGGRLVGWFKFKIFAVSLVFVYVCLSFSYGNPTTSRVIVGWVALGIDMVAVFWMWYSIETSRHKGIVGMVPLLVSPKGDLGRRGAGPPDPNAP